MKKNRSIRRTYQRQLTGYFAAAFAVFAVTLIVFQMRLDRQTKIQYIRNDLASFAGILSRTDDYAGVCGLFPQDLRATVLDRDGNVLFDSIEGLHLENHSDRPEISQSMRGDIGYSIRRSSSTGLRYLYCSESFGDRIIRVALPYDSDIEPQLRPDSVFLLASALLFALSLLTIILLSSHFGSGVTNLLMMHIQNSDKAVAVFSPGRRVEYTNSKFIQYLSAILGRPVRDVDEMWTEEFFAPLENFREENADCEKYGTFAFVGDASGKSYRTRILIYPETGFEVSIADVTESRKAAEVKQQMTSNISHELRTPVTGIMGCLETVESCPDMPEERRRDFIRRAYVQSVRLSDLIRDMAIISRIEESPEKLRRETVSLKSVVDDVFGEFGERIAAQHDVAQNCLGDSHTVYGNSSLIYAIFRNLVENSLKYAGEGVTIHIECYSPGRRPSVSSDADDSEYLFLNYYDTGNGVPEKHLARLFERFYRISEGRTRDDGGSGLGLSIVRNAVAFHGGEIRAVNRDPHGLQFFFTLKKK